MIDNGIKPIFVFDGKPPTLKTGEVSNMDFISGAIQLAMIVQNFLNFWRQLIFLSFTQLAKRTKKRAEATAELTEAKEEGDYIITYYSWHRLTIFASCR